MRPWFWLFVGPNGSGKSTLARSGTLRQWVPGIPLRVQSPDDIARALPGIVPGAEEVDYVRAAQAASDLLVDAGIARARDVAVETVGSSEKFQDRVTRAQQAGFGIGLVFVTLLVPLLNLSRVRQRAARGGHDVPADRVLARRLRSHAGFGWFAARADTGLLVDNTAAAPRLIAEKRPEERAWQVFDPASFPDLTDGLQPTDAP